VRLTLHTDYSLRLLLLLALEPDELHTIATVAHRYGISRNHMMKVAQTLIQAGYVKSVRGRHGGFRLAKRPADIMLGAVIRRTEDDLCLVGCLDQKRAACIMAPACGLRRPLAQAMAAFFAVLDRHSLADLLAQPSRVNRMRRILAVGQAGQKTKAVRASKGRKRTTGDE
jgi:Rrf2 family transcriptional regulator, nitric oxide-sensitive transcriptional repressor